MTTLKITKHHAAKNDFLILIDLAGESPVDVDLAREICDRHTGVGADGLIRISSIEKDEFRMELHNQDGSFAEISGNGIRCAGHALVDAKLHAGTDLQIHTAVGVKTLQVVSSSDDTIANVSVDMGEATIETPLPVWAREIDPGSAVVDIGNPHLVLPVEHLDDIDVQKLGQHYEALRGQGINVEWLTSKSNDLAMKVWERGVGETQACGSGSCAVARAALEWGWVERREVIVSNPGGDVVVDLRNESLILTGPVQRIASIDYECR